MEQITRRLAQYVLESKFEDIPEMVRHETKRSLIMRRWK